MRNNWLNRQLNTLTDKLDLDARYFLKGGIWLSAPLLFDYLLGMIRSIAFARLIDQETYGQFGFINSTIGIVGLLSLPGINTALIETVARGNYGSLRDAVLARARWGLLASALTFCIALYYLYIGQNDMFAAFLAAAVFLPFVGALLVTSAYFNGRKQFHRTGILNIVQSTTITTSIIIVLWLQLSVVWLVIANYTATCLVNLAFLFRALMTTTSLPHDGEMVAYGRNLTWANAISTIALEFDRVVLGISAGYADVAIYNIAAIFPQSLKSFIKILDPLVMPIIAEKPTKRIYTVETRRKLLLLFSINLAIIILGILVLPLIITLLYSAKYQSSIIYAQLLMLSLVAGLPGAFFSAALQARKQQRAIYHFNLIYGFLQISSLAILAPIWGVLGIVISRIITRLGATLYQWYAVKKL